MNSVLSYDLKLDPATHIYTLNGKVVPGVSEIMKAVGLTKDWSGVDTFYRDRGTVVHACISMFLKGTLDESTIDPSAVPYFEEFKAWWSQNKQPWIASEISLYSEKYGFAGTIDFVTEKVIYDFKCTKSPEHFTNEIQGAFYRVLVQENLKLDLPFGILQLPGNTDAKLWPYESPQVVVDSSMIFYRLKKRKK